MKKFYVGNLDDLNQEEKKTGCVSYRRIIDRYISDLVLCNNITDIDDSIWNNIPEKFMSEDIYQWFLCDLSEFEKEKLLEYGIILSYSNLLETDVLCVEHYGTSWDYVMTDIKWSTNYEECL